jgi:hypothetical protein
VVKWLFHQNLVKQAMCVDTNISFSLEIIDILLIWCNYDDHYHGKWMVFKLYYMAMLSLKRGHLIVCNNKNGPIKEWYSINVWISRVKSGVHYRFSKESTLNEMMKVHTFIIL